MAVPAMATLTRVSTMGDQFLFIQDDYNIWTFASTVNNYPRHLVVDHNGAYRYDSFNNGGSTRLGMIVPFLSSSVIGAFIGDAEDEIPLMADDIDRRLDLMYGYRGAKWDLGVHLGWWGDKEEQNGKQTGSSMSLDVGVSVNTNSGMLDINAGFQSFGWTWESLGATPVVQNEKDKGTGFNLAARYVYAYNNMVSLVPAFSYRTATIGEKASGAIGTGTEVKGSQIDIGVGCNTVPLQGTEFLTTIGYRTESLEIKDTTSTTPPPGFWEDETAGAFYIKFGADIQAKNWLFFRVGAQKNIVSTYEDKIADPVYKYADSELEYRLGAGIMVGDIQFDVELNKDWLNAGPYFLSGDDNGWMFPYISFKYDFR
jgi:hypothetical protein